MKINTKTRDFWIGLVGQVRAEDKAGGWCKQDSIRLLDELERRGLRGEFRLRGCEKERVPEGYRMNNHYWIESVEGERFVADRHAKQIDGRFLQGYFGLVKDAPEELRKFYEAA